MPRFLMIDTPPDATAYRFLAIETTLPTTNFRVREFGWKVGADWYPLAGMTSATAPTPQVVAASSYNTYPPWKAYDRVVDLTSTGSHWNTNNTGNKLIVLDLGAGNTVVPEGLRIMCYSASAQLVEAFSCYGSNDASIITIANWATASKTMLGSFAPGMTGWTAGVYREFLFT